ncbi:hypothetical protein NDU88_004222 [Pleurodeles waltl]|uniref:Uncharacterized protein n=1 Tax=Pleurodeles waltl TaxID=8319 RepID=A0AAV7WUP9_PLEWA|nr:hypothetical protein NDU88_004222 [Pleurodeles waltl]
MISSHHHERSINTAFVNKEECIGRCALPCLPITRLRRFLLKALELVSRGISARLKRGVVNMKKGQMLLQAPGNEN